MVTTTLEAEFRSKIPYDYGTAEYKLYEALIPALRKPRKVLVITDIEQDRDDLLAVLLLLHMHYLGIIEIVGFVANHYPSEKRAKLLRTVLHLCGFPEIPVVAGTDGTGGRESRDLFWHELKNQTFEHQDWNNEEYEHFCGHTSISELVNQAASDGQKVAVLCISSLQDISEYLSEQDDVILQSRFEKFVSQGGYEIHGGSIKPDMKAMNNKFHPEAAKYFTDRLSKLNIRSEAWGKEVAIAAALNQSFLDKLPGPLGYHLRWVSSRQDYKFYWDALNRPFMPHLNKEWFLETHMGFDRKSIQFQKMRNEPLSFHAFKQSGKFPAYDACAAMGVLGDDILQRLGILNISSEISTLGPHQMFGRSRDDLGGINAAKLTSALEIFIRGSLRATYKVAEDMIPSATLQYSSPSYDVPWDVFRIQLQHLKELQSFKKGEGIEPEAIERFMKKAFGDEEISDDSGKEYPILPETIPYDMLFAADGGDT